MDGTKAMRRRIQIQIQSSDMAGINGYRVSQEQYKGTKLRTIATQATEDEIETLLNEFR
jgi:hypothetical protein